MIESKTQREIHPQAIEKEYITVDITDYLPMSIKAISNKVQDSIDKEANVRITSVQIRVDTDFTYTDMHNDKYESRLQVFAVGYIWESLEETKARLLKGAEIRQKIEEQKAKKKASSAKAAQIRKLNQEKKEEALYKKLKEKFETKK